MAEAAPPSAAQTAEILDDLILSQIEIRRAGGEVISDADVETIRAEAGRLVNDDTVVKLKDAVKDGVAAKEFLQMNFMNGLPGAVALITALAAGAGLTKKKTDRFLERLVLPWGKITDRGGLMISFVPAGGELVEYHLHTGAAAANHDFASEFKKVEALAGGKDLERIRNQCAMLVFFTRQAYMKILELNAELFDKKVIPGLVGATISEGIGVANSTVFLQKTVAGGEPVPLEPRVGLFFSLKT